MIQLYGQSKDIENALKIFNNCNEKNVFIINAMMTVYIDNGYDEMVLKLFNEMDMKYCDIQKDHIMYSIAIKR